MLAIISPAKKLKAECQLPHGLSKTNPIFLNKAAELADIMRSKSPSDLSELMSISDKLAQLNVARYQQWKARVDDSSVPVTMMFQGDVYQGLDAASLTIKQLKYIQQHLVIMSGLYGSLRPFDAVYPYRLEMGAPLSNNAGNNLYDFWSKLLTEHLAQQLQQYKQPVLINLASNEYSSVIDFHSLPARVIKPVFKDYKNGTYKIISFFAKRARGLMARYMALQSISEADGLKAFDLGGYSYNKAMSTNDNWVFNRARIE